MQLTDGEWSLLNLLSWQPWLTPEQMGHWLDRASSRVLADLKVLLEHGMIQRVNPRCGWIPVRTVYTLTDYGVSFLAQEAGTEVNLFRRQQGISRSRHTLLLWRLNRVWQVRNLMLGLDSTEWLVKRVETEVDAAYKKGGKGYAIHLHGYGEVVKNDTESLGFVVEWDSWNARTDDKRLLQFARWFYGERSQVGFDVCPLVLLVVAENRRRFSEIMEMCRGLRQVRGYLQSQVFLTTASLLATRGPGEKVWCSAQTGVWGHAFEGMRWGEKALKAQFSVLTRPSRIRTFSEVKAGSAVESGTRDFLALKLSLSPIAKRVFHCVLRYPLLTTGEIVVFGDETEWRVRKELGALTEHGLVEVHRCERESCFVLTPLGWRCAAMEAGYGRALKRFAKGRGSVRNVRRLVFHLAHTRATNLFFLEWVRMARQRAVSFEWIAEAECGVYFRRGSRLHAWLPDGLGIWQGKEGAFRFVVEMDRTRESRKNLGQKFREYYWWREWMRERGLARESPQVLVVTTGWKRAARIREVLEEARLFKAFAPLPLWVTTFRDIEKEGIGGSVWRSNREWESQQRLTCFEHRTSSDPDFAGG